MKNKYLLMSIPLILLAWNCFAQENEWEPQKQVTGYLSLEGNYYNNLKFFDRDYAVSMPEAGILFNYKPLSKLTFKGVFVYRPNWLVRDMVSEVSAEWKFSDAFKIKAGHMLTPLSPVNTFFYAPVNLGVALPLIVSSHFIYPTSMEALSINGIYGNNFKIDYDVFGGGYFNSVGLHTGAMGFFGLEDNYYSSVQSNSTLDKAGKTDINSEDLMYGTGGHLRFSYQDYIQVGFNFFAANEKISMGTDSEGNALLTNLDKEGYGINFRLKYNSLLLTGESWKSAFHFSNMDASHVNGTFVELSNSFGKITPYARFENKISMGTIMERYIAGVNFKPIFETTFKLEYFAYNKYDLNGILFAVVYSF